MLDLVLADPVLADRLALLCPAGGFGTCRCNRANKSRTESVE